MSLKEFLKPTIVKMVLTIVLVIASHFLFSPFFYETPGYCLLCVGCPCYPGKFVIDYYNIIINIIFYYLVSCLIVFLVRKYRK